MQGVGLAVAGGIHERRPAILFPINSIHIGVVRACERVHGVGVAVPGGNHQRRPAILSNSLHTSIYVPARAVTVSVWP